MDTYCTMDEESSLRVPTPQPGSFDGNRPEKEGAAAQSKADRNAVRAPKNLSLAAARATHTRKMRQCGSRRFVCEGPSVGMIFIWRLCFCHCTNDNAMTAYPEYGFMKSS